MSPFFLKYLQGKGFMDKNQAIISTEFKGIMQVKMYTFLSSL